MNSFFDEKNYTFIQEKINASISFRFGFSINGDTHYQTKILETMKYIYTKRDFLNMPPDFLDEQQTAFLNDKTIKYYILSFEKSMEDGVKIQDTSRINYLASSEMASTASNMPLPGLNINNSMNLDLGIVSPGLVPDYTTHGLGNSPYTMGAQPESQPESQTESQTVSQTESQPESQPELSVKSDSELHIDSGELFNIPNNSTKFILHQHNLVIDTADTGIGISDPRYNPFKPNVKFIEGSKNSDTNNIYITHKFTNIHSIRLTRIIIPNGITQFDYPFLYLCIKEYASNIVTSNGIRNIFSKVYLDNNTSQLIQDSVTKNGFCYYINTENSILEFKTPLPNLSNLSISLVTPRGDILKYVQNGVAAVDSSSTVIPGYFMKDYVQYMFDITTLSNYIPHINAPPFNI